MKIAIEEAKQITVIALGVGKVVSNWGTYGGFPAVFLEPVKGVPGAVGDVVPDGRETQIAADGVSPGSVVIEVRSEAGLKVLVEDIWKALHSYNEAHPEPLNCSDCMLVHGKSVCQMNCGPAASPRGHR